jgi:hypothetical protein
MDLREIWWKDIGWIQLTEERDQWQALVNMVMNLLVGFHKRWGIS